MATREENIKKINDELEKLSDDELEKVAGGDLLRKSHYEKASAQQNQNNNQNNSTKNILYKIF